MITAEYFSELGGEITIEYDTYSKSERTGSRENTYTHNEQKTKRRLFTPDEILRTKPLELKCFCNGLGVMQLKKFDYSRHHMYKFISKYDVNEYEPERKNKPKQEEQVIEVKPIEKEEKGIEKIVKIDDIRNL